MVNLKEFTVEFTQTEITRQRIVVEAMDKEHAERMVEEDQIDNSEAQHVNTHELWYSDVCVVSDKDEVDARPEETWPSESCMETMLPMVADSWAELRGCDVYRLLNAFSYERRSSLLLAAQHIANKRPDLASQIRDCQVELEQEYECEWQDASPHSSL